MLCAVKNEMWLPAYPTQGIRYEVAARNVLDIRYNEEGGRFVKGGEPFRFGGAPEPITP
jgi:hypothetical protein